MDRRRHGLAAVAAVACMLFCTATIFYFLPIPWGAIWRTMNQPCNDCPVVIVVPAPAPNYAPRLSTPRISTPRVSVPIGKR
jgi:hypothetical protein